MCGESRRAFRNNGCVPPLPWIVIKEDFLPTPCIMNQIPLNWIYCVTEESASAEAAQFISLRQSEHLNFKLFWRKIRMKLLIFMLHIDEYYASTVPSITYSRIFASSLALDTKIWWLLYIWNIAMKGDIKQHNNAHRKNNSSTDSDGVHYIMCL